MMDVIHVSLRHEIPANAAKLVINEAMGGYAYVLEKGVFAYESQGHVTKNEVWDQALEHARVLNIDRLYNVIKTDELAI